MILLSMKNSKEGITIFTFKSPVNSKNIWTLCFRDKTEMDKIYYKNKPMEEGARIHSITEFMTSTIYIDKELDGFPLMKAIRRELTHIYLWETGQQDRIIGEEELCDFMSVAAPAICKTAENIGLRLKEGLYKKGE